MPRIERNVLVRAPADRVYAVLEAGVPLAGLWPGSEPLERRPAEWLVDRTPGGGAVSWMLSVQNRATKVALRVECRDDVCDEDVAARALEALRDSVER